MTNWRWILPVCFCLGLPLSASAAPKDGQTFQDWIIRCSERAETVAVEPCVMRQSVLPREGERPIMQIMVGILKDNRRPGVIITVPLGVRLPPGLSLRIDQSEEIRMAYHRCVLRGCQSQLILTEQLEAVLKAGLQGEVTFRGGAGRSISVLFSLKGFTAALNSLR